MLCSEPRSPLLSSQLRSVCLGDDVPYSTVTLGNKTNVPLNVVQGPLCMDVSRKGRKTIFYPIAAGSKIFYTSTFVPLERSIGAFTCATISGTLGKSSGRRSGP